MFLYYQVKEKRSFFFVHFGFISTRGLHYSLWFASDNHGKSDVTKRHFGFIIQAEALCDNMVIRFGAPSLRSAACFSAFCSSRSQKSSVPAFGRSSLWSFRQSRHSRRSEAPEFAVVVLLPVTARSLYVPQLLPNSPIWVFRGALGKGRGSPPLFGRALAFSRLKPR